MMPLCGKNLQMVKVVFFGSAMYLPPSIILSSFPGAYMRTTWDGRWYCKRTWIIMSWWDMTMFWILSVRWKLHLDFQSVGLISWCHLIAAKSLIVSGGESIKNRKFGDYVHFLTSRQMAVSFYLIISASWMIFGDYFSIRTSSLINTMHYYLLKPFHSLWSINQVKLPSSISR